MQRDTNEKSGKKSNNSLEFYNDDMPRKAVGKLFNVLDDDEPTLEEGQDEEEQEVDSDIVSGYEDEVDADYYEPSEPRRRQRTPDEPSMNERESRPARSKDYREETSARREKYEFIEEADVRSGMVKRGNNYDFGMYRRKDKKPSASPPTAKRKSIYEDDYEEEKPAKRYYNTAPVPVQSPGPKPKPKSKARARQGEDTESIMKKSQSARFFDDDYAEESKESALARILAAPGALRIIAAAVCVLFLIILMMLIIKLNIDSGKMKVYEEQVEDYNTMKESFSALQIQYDAARERISELESQLESGYNEPNGNSGGLPGIDIDSPDSLTEPTDPSGGTSSTASPSGRRYTVRSGDTLMKIASEQMGDSSKYRQLMDANNLSGTDLQVGQELIIP